MNFPVSPSAGFTLKKQYVKYLFEVILRKKIGLIFDQFKAFSDFAVTGAISRYNFISDL